MISFDRQLGRREVRLADPQGAPPWRPRKDTDIARLHQTGQSYEDLRAAGSCAVRRPTRFARAQEHVVQDGDVITFKFSFGRAASRSS